MPVKHTVTIEGKPIEVEIPDQVISAAGFMPTASFEEALGKRALQIARNQGYTKPEDLLDNPEFVQKVLDKAGVKPGTSQADQAAIVQEAIARARREFEAKDLVPLQEQLKSRESREDELLAKDLSRQIIMAANAAGVKRSLLKPSTPNGIPPIVSMLQDNFGYDTDSQEFFVLRGQDGFEFSQLGQRDRVYMTVDEYVDRFVADKVNADFLETRGQQGPGMQRPDGGRPNQGAGQPVHISREASRDLRQLVTARDEATKRGLDPYNGGIVIDE